MEIRAVQAIALTLRGEAPEASGFLDRLVADARQAGRPDLVASGLGAAVIARAGLGEPEAAASLLAVIEATPDLGEAIELAAYLPAIVRAAIQIGEPELAERLVAHLAPRFPYAEHALVVVGAALAEARGEPQAAADAYADAASRWEGFGVLPEQGFALAGQGRCLVELTSPSEASEILQQARAIFTGCGMGPALEETDALFAKATALSS